MANMFNSKHLKSKHEEPSISCAAAQEELCELMFKDKRAMERHAKSSHRIFSSRPESGLSSETIECVPCKQTFARDDVFTRHMKEQHEGKGRRLGKNSNALL